MSATTNDLRSYREYQDRLADEDKADERRERFSTPPVAPVMHSPLPWRLLVPEPPYIQAGRIVSAEGERIATLPIHREPDREARAIADGRIMAAAGDLYAACTLMLSLIQACDSPEFWNHMKPGWLAMQAAVDKAKIAQPNTETQTCQPKSSN